jgi:hypothetical protein
VVCLCIKSIYLHINMVAKISYSWILNVIYFNCYTFRPWTTIRVPYTGCRDCTVSLHLTLCPSDPLNCFKCLFVTVRLFIKYFELNTCTGPCHLQLSVRLHVIQFNVSVMRSTNLTLEEPWAYAWAIGGSSHTAVRPVMWGWC